MKKFLAGLIASLLMAVSFAAPVNYAVRPASSVGTGYFVAGNKVFDPNGKEFPIHGVNINHFDVNHVGIPLLKPNVVRTALYLTRSTDYNWGLIQNDIIARGLVPMVETQTTTCKNDFATLDNTVNMWVAQAPSTWVKLNDKGFFNPANEWGPAATGAADKGVGFLNGWLQEIPKIRGSGITAPIVIDGGNCGQDAATIAYYGKQLLAADPEHNLIFSAHVYASYHYPATASWMQDYSKAMASLKATGLPIILGEFGPAPFTDANGVVHKIGQSPTAVPTATLIADAEANGFGWMPWSYDDNNLLNCKANDFGFALVTNVCTPYTGTNDAAELTSFGKTMKAMWEKYQVTDNNIPGLSFDSRTGIFTLDNIQPGMYQLTITYADTGKVVPVTIVISN